MYTFFVAGEQIWRSYVYNSVKLTSESMKKMKQKLIGLKGVCMYDVSLNFKVTVLILFAKKNYFRRSARILQLGFEPEKSSNAN